MLIQFALSLVVLLGFCGLALDAGMLELTKLKLQNAADAAALGAAYFVPDPAAETLAGRAESKANGFTNGSNTATVTISIPTSGTYANNPQAALAVVTQQTTTTFFPSAPLLSAQATALANPPTCAYFLSQSLTSEASISGDNVAIGPSGSTKCGIYLGYSYFFNGGSSSTGYFYTVAGSGRADSGSVSPAAVTGANTVADPLLSFPAPPTQPCLKTGSYTVPSSVTVLQPGLYCGGLTISTGTTVTLNPGIYQIAGPLTITSPSGGFTTVVQASTPVSPDTGSGVMFYLTQGSGNPYGVALIENASVTLTAPAAGTWKGILFFADRSLPSPASQLDGSGISQALLQISNYSIGGSTATLDGVLYLPHQGLQSSHSNLRGVNSFEVVADWYTLNNTSIYLSHGANSPLSSGGAALVQ